MTDIDQYYDEDDFDPMPQPADGWCERPNCPTCNGPLQRRYRGLNGMGDGGPLPLPPPVPYTPIQRDPAAPRDTIFLNPNPVIQTGRDMPMPTPPPLTYPNQPPRELDTGAPEGAMVPDRCYSCGEPVGEALVPRRRRGRTLCEECVARQNEPREVREERWSYEEMRRQDRLQPGQTINVNPPDDERPPDCPICAVRGTWRDLMLVYDIEGEPDPIYVGLGYYTYHSPSDGETLGHIDGRPWDYTENEGWGDVDRGLFVFRECYCGYCGGRRRDIPVDTPINV